MPKYYVNAGQFKKIIDHQNPQIAAIEAFRTLEDDPVPAINSITIVSEEGFDSNNENDWCFLTMELLEQSDQINSYKPDF